MPTLDYYRREKPSPWLTAGLTRWAVVTAAAILLLVGLLAFAWLCNVGPLLPTFKTLRVQKLKTEAQRNLVAMLHKAEPLAGEEYADMLGFMEACGGTVLGLQRQQGSDSARLTEDDALSRFRILSHGQEQMGQGPLTWYQLPTGKLQLGGSPAEPISPSPDGKRQIFFRPTSGTALLVWTPGWQKLSDTGQIEGYRYPRLEATYPGLPKGISATHDLINGGGSTSWTQGVASFRLPATMLRGLWIALVAAMVLAALLALLCRSDRAAPLWPAAILTLLAIALMLLYLSVARRIEPTPWFIDAFRPAVPKPPKPLPALQALLGATWLLAATVWLHWRVAAAIHTPAGRIGGQKSTPLKEAARGS